MFARAHFRAWYEENDLKKNGQKSHMRVKLVGTNAFPPIKLAYVLTYGTVKGCLAVLSYFSVLNYVAYLQKHLFVVLCFIL